MNDLLTENFIDIGDLLLLIDADDSANSKPSDELGNIFWGWTMEMDERALTGFDGVEFERLREDLQRDG